MTCRPSWVRTVDVREWRHEHLSTDRRVAVTTYLRADWGSVTVNTPAVAIPGPLGDVFVHHTVTGTPTTVESAMSTMRGIQRYHIDSSGYSDIGYSWCVDQLGNIYEGRGWLRQGAHTYGRNSTSHGIAWLGDSTKVTPSNAALAGIAQCITDGQRVGAVTLYPTILGHRDALGDTACPGDLLYAALPAIRAAVLDLPPATIDPPEDDPMTQEDKDWVSAQLASLTDWLQGQLNAVSGNVTNNAAYLGQWMQGLAGEHQQIMARLAALEAKLAAPSADDIVLAAARRIVQ